MGKLSGIHFSVPWEHVRCECNLVMGLTFEQCTEGWNNSLPPYLACNCVVKTKSKNGIVVLSSFGEDVKKYLEIFGRLVRIVIQHKRNCEAHNVNQDDFILPIAIYYNTDGTCSWSYGDILLGIGYGYEKGIAEYMTELIKWVKLSVEEIVELSLDSYCGIHVFVA